MNLTKVEKATIATALAIFEEQITEPDNEVSNRDPLNTLTTLVIIHGLLRKLDLVDIYKELEESAKRRMNEDK